VINDLLQQILGDSSAPGENGCLSESHRAGALGPQVRSEIGRGAAVARCRKSVAFSTRSSEVEVGDRLDSCEILEDSMTMINEEASERTTDRNPGVEGRTGDQTGPLPPGCSHLVFASSSRLTFEQTPMWKDVTLPHE